MHFISLPEDGKEAESVCVRVTCSRVMGEKEGWCPYFIARHLINYANVVVYSYQVLSLIDQERERERALVNESRD